MCLSARACAYAQLLRWVEQYYDCDLGPCLAAQAVLAALIDEASSAGPHAHLALALQEKLTAKAAEAALALATHRVSSVRTAPRGGQWRSGALAGVTATDLAFHLAQTDAELLAAVAPWHLLVRFWSKADLAESGPPLHVFIERFNALSDWVASEIVREAREADRARLIELFIATADALRRPDISDYSALVAVISGLASADVTRLRRSWARVGARFMRLHGELEALMASSNNFARYRAAASAASGPPFIPFLGLIMRDLFVTVEHNPMHRDQPDASADDSVVLINFSVCASLGNMVLRVCDLLPSSYRSSFREDEALAAYTRSLAVLDRDARYELSRELEPDVRAHGRARSYSGQA